MRIIERLKDAYYTQRDKRLLRQINNNSSFFIKSGSVSERQIEYLKSTPEFQSLYREFNEAYHEPDKIDKAREILRTLTLPQFAAFSGLLAEEMRSNHEDEE